MSRDADRECPLMCTWVCTREPRVPLAHRHPGGLGELKGAAVAAVKRCQGIGKHGTIFFNYFLFFSSGRGGRAGVEEKGGGVEGCNAWLGKFR